MKHRRNEWLCRAVGLLTMVLTYVALWLLLSTGPGCADRLGLSVEGCAWNVQIPAYLYAIAAGAVGVLASWGLSWLLTRRGAR